MDYSLFMRKYLAQIEANSFFPGIHEVVSRSFLGNTVFFDSVSKLLAQKLKVRHIFIGELSKDRAHIFCSMSDGILRESADFEIKETSVEKLIQTGYLACPSGALNHFPKDKYLHSIKAESFFSKLILTGTENPAGFFSIAHDQKMEETPEVKIALEIMALCLGSEFERRSAENESEKNYQQVLDAIADMVLVKGPKSRILWANKAFRDYYGMSNEQLKNIIDAPFNEPDITQQYVKDDACVFESGKVLNIQEEPVTRFDGKVFFYNTVKSPIFDAQGKVVMTVGVSRDVTESKKISAQLFQSQKLETMGTLAGGIAHDLNNQLTPILGFLDLALMGMDSSASSYQYIEEAKKSTLHSTGIIRRLVNFSRPSSGGKTILSLSELLNGLKPIFKQLLSSMIEVELKIAGNLDPIFGNRNELESMIVNLAANAKDAIAGGGKFMISAENFIPQIKVKVKNTSDLGNIPYVLLTVKDTGCGMKPDVIKQIFDPFFTTKKPGEGTGLGLAMVHKVVTDHQGIIEVQSVPDKGTDFKIYLPAKPESLSDSLPIEPAVKTLKHSDSVKEAGKILFVDDEKGIRDVGEHFLKNLGYEVILACDGEEALSIYRQKSHSITAVILDMTMPKLPGREVLRGLLQINPKVKIIVCSGYTAEALPQELIQLGAFDFIEKPYSLDLLSQALKKMAQ